MTENRDEGTDPEDRRRPQREYDPLAENYRTILNELGLLTTVSVLLFGFLLASPSLAGPTLTESLYAVAIVMVATATLVFVLPVAYHHLQFPYRDFEKFQSRAHRWVILGVPLLAGSLYLSLALAIWTQFDEAALAIAAVPFVATLIAFMLRKEA